MKTIFEVIYGTLSLCILVYVTGLICYAIG